MASIVESWARQIGWQIGTFNVIVEGTSDVALLRHARDLWLAERRLDVFGEGFAIVAAGSGDDGGVDGVNRRFNAARQFSEVDLDAEGRRRYRFIGLFDNDRAGQRALTRACEFDRRVVRYRDLFLLHPEMPLANGDPGPKVERRAKSLNESCRDLDWEIEDLLSDDIYSTFRTRFPNAILRETTKGGRTHRDFTREGKVQFRRFVLSESCSEDVVELVWLVCALRDYLGLAHNHLFP